MPLSGAARGHASDCARFEPQASDDEAKWAGWTPTVEAINALPEPIRRYVHDLETRCDPAGDVRTIVCQRDQIEGLVALLDEARSGPKGEPDATL